MHLILILPTFVVCTYVTTLVSRLSTAVSLLLITKLLLSTNEHYGIMEHCKICKNVTLSLYRV
jgi:hypothetical protein